MKKLASILLTLVVVLGLSLVPAASTVLAQEVPVWCVNNTWVYNCTYVSGTGVNDTGELNVTVTNTTGANYTLFADYVPDANRVDATTGSDLTVKDADIIINKTNLCYLRQDVRILAYGWLPDNAHITWNYTSKLEWPPTVNETYNFTKHTWDDWGIVDKTVNRTGKVLEIANITGVPAGNFSCYYIEEYDPTDPGNFTYRHWFNETVVKSDVKQIDCETYKGVETRNLTFYNVTDC